MVRFANDQLVALLYVRVVPFPIVRLRSEPPIVPVCVTVDVPVIVRFVTCPIVPALVKFVALVIVWVAGMDRY
jgi:hypothetical protein